MGRGLRQCSCSPFDVWGIALPLIPWNAGYNGLNGGMTNYAVKIPAVYRPYLAAMGRTGRGELPPISSGDAVGDENWLVTLAPSRYTPGESLPDQSMVQASRAIYLDGVQKWIVYNTTSTGDEEYEVGGIFNFIDIETKQNTTAYIGYDASTDILHTPRISSGSGQPVPGSWSIGRQYFVCSFYHPGLTGWRVYRIRFANGAKVQTQDESNVGFDGTRYNIVLPSRRCYLRSTVSPDEPWCLAHRASDDSYVTGRWRNEDTVASAQVCALNSSEVEHVLSTGTFLKCHCYNRIRDKDLAIFTNFDDSVWYYYDGDQLQTITSGLLPSFITMDHDGGIVYGSKYFVRKLGADGWTHVAAQSQTAGVVDSQLFEILCNRRWIQLRGWQATLFNASVDHDEDTPIIGNDGLSWFGNSDDPFLGWSFSYDGTIRLPHCLRIERPRDPSGGNATNHDAPGTARILARAYYSDYHPGTLRWVANPLYPEDSDEPWIEIANRAVCTVSAESYFVSSFYAANSNQSFDIIDPCPPGSLGCRALPALWNF